ncbi:AMP-binding protein, partial [Schlesneria sp.]|uniref:AMP-binding protein n=1 Tax=Schlesneria sp. TaxID=2762018 RepID=UPI002F0D40AE
MSPQERHRILVEWNQTESPFRQNLTIHQWFAEQAARTPDAVAIVFGNESLTYRTMNQQADRLARILRSLGVGPDERVGFFLDRSPKTFVTILAILKAGGAYVPLDTSLPQQRLEFLLRDSNCKAVVTTRELSARLGTFETLQPGHQGPQCLLLDEIQWDVLERDPPEETLFNDAESHHLAYVIYTSGSTGQPKGVAMHHRGLVNLTQWQCETSKHDVGDRTL